MCCIFSTFYNDTETGFSAFAEMVEYFQFHTADSQACHDLKCRDLRLQPPPRENILQLQAYFCIISVPERVSQLRPNLIMAPGHVGSAPFNSI